jgi:hypothetical protein
MGMTVDSVRCRDTGHLVFFGIADASIKQFGAVYKAREKPC